MEREQAADIARAIAALITNNRSDNPDIGDLAQRVEALESKLGVGRSMTVSAVSHSSQEKFKIAEAIVDRAFAAKTSEGNCSFEPGNKPCDHCSMCSSRGF